MSERLAARFTALAAEGRAALVTYVCGGDPDFETGLEILRALPSAGADVVELGMAFSDPMADGPSIQAGNLRALEAGVTLEKTLAMAKTFREGDPDTPLVLMGYFNPIHKMGVATFLDAARSAGVDGLIVVDLPPEEDGELRDYVASRGLAFIRLATPTTDDARMARLARGASGFLYYVSITGVTGAAAPNEDVVARAVARIRQHVDLPICVGFGVRRPEQAAAIARYADGVVVGSALVDAIAAAADRNAKVEAVRALTSRLAEAVRATPKAACA